MSGKIDRSYKQKVWLFSILGYVYIITIVLAITATAAALVYIAVESHSSYAVFKIVIALGFFLFLILKALWVSFDKPTGIEVSESNIPELARFVSDLRTKLNGPGKYKILLTDDFNASIMQYPRLGILGWYQNYVLLGVPLMMVLSPEELKAVLAHEFGHLKETHGIWSVKIYRNREVWLQLMENLDKKRHWGAFLFKGFFKWYLPKLEEYSLSLFREQEFEADKEAVSIAGKNTFGSFLVKYDIYEDRINNAFWRDIFRKIQIDTEATDEVYEEMDNFLNIPLEKEYQDKIIARGLKVETDGYDTHPSLKDRLKAAGYEAADYAYVMEESRAADMLLGEEKESIIKLLSRKWKEDIFAYWTDKYEELQKIQAELQELTASGEFNENNHLRMAQILEELDREEEALEKYEEILVKYPENLEAMFSKGKILITKDSTGEEGKSILDTVMEKGNGYSYYGTKLVYDYLVHNGRNEESRIYYEIGMRETAKVDEAIEEREVILLKDQFVPHELKVEEVEKIKDQIKGLEKIKEIYLAKKVLTQYQDDPLFVLGILFKTSNNKYIENAVQEIADNVVFPGQTIVMPLNGDNFRFYKKQKKVQNSLIFKQSKGFLTAAREQNL